MCGAFFSKNHASEFARFVVCRMCYSVYTFDACVERHGTSTIIKYCYPNSHSAYHTLLFKTVKLLGGKTKLYPFKVYCYQQSFQRLLNCPY